MVITKINTKYWKINELKKYLKVDNLGSIVTRSVGEDTKIKIKLMQEAEEYGRIETKKEIMEIIEKAEKIDGYVPDKSFCLSSLLIARCNQDLIKKIKQFIAGANE